MSIPTAFTALNKLMNAGFSSDIWAFGCIVYQYLVGRPPFRGATDYLTFQKILKGQMDISEDLDEEAKDLIELVLVRLPRLRACSISG